MKRRIYHFLLIITGLLPVTVAANPLYYPPPQAFISELFFDASYAWTLELEMFIDPHLPTTGIIDSIVLKSHAGRTRITGYPVAWHALFVITAANTVQPLNLNSLSDTLTVITYANPTVYNYGTCVNHHKLVYGYAGCEIPGILNGQSVCAREYNYGNPLYFYLDDTPTLWLPNNTEGATVELTGRFYDIRDSLITCAPPTYPDHYFAVERNVDPCYYGNYPAFYCPIFIFSFDSTGNYITKMLSRNSLVNKISYLFYHGAIGFSSNWKLPCEDFSFFLEPGSTMVHDIHLIDSTFLVGKHEPPGIIRKINMICYPNPVQTTADFYIMRDQASAAATIGIRDASGKIVLELPVPAGKDCKVPFNRHQLGKPGLYLYTLAEKGHIVATGKILCK